MTDDILPKSKKSWRCDDINCGLGKPFIFASKRYRRYKIERIVRVIVFVVMIPAFLRINQAIESGRYFSEIGFALLYSAMLMILVHNWEGASRIELLPKNQFIEGFVVWALKLRKFYITAMPILALNIVLGVNLILYDIFLDKPVLEKTLIHGLSTTILFLFFGVGMAIQVFKCNRELRHLIGEQDNSEL